MKKYFSLVVLFLTVFCFTEKVFSHSENEKKQAICLDKIQMNVVKTAASGVVNHETIFHFSQNNGIVSANYTGGKIQQGFLVGRFTTENELVFSYCQMQLDGKLDNGASKCVVSRNENGKVILTEHFEWASRPGEFGTNIFQEL
ncbi:MAG: n-acetylglutamate synthase [Chlamydiia bacterium]|nr:n-acetylglutamate synthase [Chlamydiia bacterium]